MLPGAVTLAFAMLSCGGGESGLGHDTRSARRFGSGEEGREPAMQRIFAVTPDEVLYGLYRQGYRQWRYIGPLLTNQDIEIDALFPIPSPPTHPTYVTTLLPSELQSNRVFHFNVGYQF